MGLFLSFLLMVLWLSFLGMVILKAFVTFKKIPVVGDAAIEDTSVVCLDDDVVIILTRMLMML